jgi:hypothetical protein
MSEEKNDRTRIDINDPKEIEYWCRQLGLSPRLLRELVQKHGASVEAIGKAAKLRWLP